MTSTQPTHTTATARPPATVIGAVVLAALAAAVGCFGLVYFGAVATDVNPAAGTPAALGFTAVGVLLVLSALAALPGLWRGRAVSWHVLTCYLAASIYFSCYKILVEGEVDSVVFLVVHLAVAALLLAPPSRRHARV